MSSRRQIGLAVILLCLASFKAASAATDTCDKVLFTEDFDGVTAPALPAGWTSSVALSGIPWITRSGSSETVPNAAFGYDREGPAEEMLETPAIGISAMAAKLTFRNRWRFDFSNGYCKDAGVLEIKIGAGPYVDIVAAGGSFVSGGYTGTVAIPYGNPLADRAAWCGTSPGWPAYLTTEVILPATTSDQTIQLRWRLGSDNSNAEVGQDIDSLNILGSATDPCAGLNCDDNSPCTQDACVPCSGCVHTFLCNDNNVCTTDTCDPVLGCVYTNNTNPCEDGIACTTGDTCGGGTCRSGAGGCDDHNPCTFDVCHWPNCDYSPLDNAPCDDGNACTSGERCFDTHCMVLGVTNCDDNNPCTADGCNPSSGCFHTNITGPCNDGNACTTGDACGSGVCSGSPITAPVETLNVTVDADKSTYRWSAVAGATRYDVLRGGTGAFPVGPGGGDETCFDDLAGTTLTDMTIPVPGTGFWYVSRGENACGNGTYGTQSDGTPRPSATCP